MVETAEGNTRGQKPLGFCDGEFPQQHHWWHLLLVPHIECIMCAPCSSSFLNLSEPMRILVLVLPSILWLPTTKYVVCACFSQCGLAVAPTASHFQRPWKTRITQKNKTQGGKTESSSMTYNHVHTYTRTCVHMHNAESECQSPRHLASQTTQSMFDPNGRLSVGTGAQQNWSADLQSKNGQAQPLWQSRHKARRRHSSHRR